MVIRENKPKFNLVNLAIIGLQRVREWIHFYKRNFDSPYPTLVKRKTLMAHAVLNANWIETGTYVGSTSKFLSKRFPKVTTIEPSDHFFNLSTSRLAKSKNVKLIFGTSEDEFENALNSEKYKLNIWLDGHFSEGGTYLGDEVSPVIHELKAISKFKDRFDNLTVFVDDVRLFSRDREMLTGYPPLTQLFDWANENGFIWQIQNDIFIAKLNR